MPLVRVRVTASASRQPIRRPRSLARNLRLSHAPASHADDWRHPHTCTRGHVYLTTWCRCTCRTRTGVGAAPSWCLTTQGIGRWVVVGGRMAEGGGMAKEGVLRRGWEGLGAGEEGVRRGLVEVKAKQIERGRVVGRFWAWVCGAACAPPLLWPRVRVCRWQEREPAWAPLLRRTRFGFAVAARLPLPTGALEAAGSAVGAGSAAAVGGRLWRPPSPPPAAAGGCDGRGGRTPGAVGRRPRQLRPRRWWVRSVCGSMTVLTM